MSTVHCAVKEWHHPQFFPPIEHQQLCSDKSKQSLVRLPKKIRSKHLSWLILFGRIPPQEERLLARLTAWTQAVRDPSVRAALLTTSLTRLRKETPDLFLILVKEWLHPARKRMWSNGIQALVPLISSTEFDNLPPIFEIMSPILKASPAALQFDIQELLAALYKKSSDETIYFIQQTLKSTKSELPAISLRRMLPDLPHDLQVHLREILRKTV